MTDTTKQDWDFSFENWENVTLDSTKYFFHQAEKMLESVISISDSFQTRASKLITVLVPVLFAISAYVAKNYDNLMYSLPLSVVILALYYALYNCFQILNTHYSFRTGSLPEHIMNPIWEKISTENQTKAIILNECRNYQLRIKYRIEANDKAGERFRYSIKSIIFSPIAAGAIYALLLLGNTLC